MKSTISPWRYEVERGPDWLFVRLNPPEDEQDPMPNLDEQLWDLYKTHFAHRMVLEMEEVPMLTSRMIGQLITLQNRIAAEGGLMRVCGLTPECEKALCLCHAEGSLSNFSSRSCAVHADNPKQPR